MSPTHLWNRNFILWLLGLTQSQLGNAIGSLALSFLVLEQTGSAGKMAITLAFANLPQLLGPLAGAWIDRLNLKLPLIASDIFRGVLQLALGIYAFNAGEVPLWIVNAVAFAMGLAGIFAAPASSAAVPQLVPKDELARANGLLGSAGQSAMLIGMLAGGFLVALFSPPIAILLDGASFLLMAVLLLFVQLPPKKQQSAQQSSLRTDMLAGIRLIRRSRLLTLIPVLAITVNVVAIQIMAVMPKLMEALGQGSTGYGLYMALSSTGLLASGLLFAVLGKHLPLRHMVSIGFFAFALTFAVMWWQPQYMVILVGGVFAGFCSGFINTPTFTLLQKHVPQEFLARVFSVLMTTSSLGIPISLFLFSPLLDRWPMHIWFGFSAIAMLFAGIAWLFIILSEPEMPDLQHLT